MTTNADEERRWTAGPWLYVPHGEIVGADDRSVCMVLQRQDVENGHLIAASPTMAEYIHKRAMSGDEEAAEIWRQINAPS